MLSQKRREQIRNMAKAATFILGPITKYPLDLDALLSKFEIELYEVNMDLVYPTKNISGILSIENGGHREIYINSAHNENRGRFTVAHELGHFLLHGDELEENGKIVSFRGDYENSDKELENEADFFAAELLMPKDIVYKIAEIDSQNNTSFLANYFGVSKVAMSRRIKELNEE